MRNLRKKACLLNDSEAPRDNIGSVTTITQRVRFELNASETTSFEERWPVKQVSVEQKTG